METSSPYWDQSSQSIKTPIQVQLVPKNTFSQTFTLRTPSQSSPRYFKHRDSLTYFLSVQFLLSWALYNMSFLVYRTVCGTLATGSELFHLYLRMTLQISELACEVWKDSFAITVNYLTQVLHTSARSILGYQLTLIHSFNLRYTTYTKDTHTHNKDHLLLGKACAYSTSIQVHYICGFTDT